MSIFIERFSMGDGDSRVAIKDTIDIAEMRTRAGSRALQDTLPAEKNAAVVDRLLEGRYRIVGKANLHELAFGMTGVNGWTGTPINPNFPELIPGGSSSGSAAAVAAGEADIAIGTDTGGSIRVPAACCGIVGLKPTFGRISRDGVLPRQTTLDCVGPMARDMDTLIAAMHALDPTFRTEVKHSETRLGWIGTGASTPVADEVDRFIRQTGMTIQTLRLPLMDEAFSAGLSLISRETWQAYQLHIESGLLGQDVHERLIAASRITDKQVEEAEKIRTAFTQAVDDALEDSTVLALPTLPDFPMRMEDALAGRTDLSVSSLVRPFNLSGHPALTLPTVSAAGLPVGIQLIGRRGADELVCQLGKTMLQINRDRALD